MIKRYVLVQHDGKIGIVINDSDDAGAMENGAQIFNEQNNGYTYFVIDKLNPPREYEDEFINKHRGLGG